jgi:hypothetical protein
MSQHHRFCLIFAIVAGVGFIGTWIVLGALLPNYDPIAQTIGESGEKGSPFEMPFKIANLLVAGCFVLLSYGVYRFSVARQLSLVPRLTGRSRGGSANCSVPDDPQSLLG